MLDEIKELSEYEIRKIIGQYGALSGPQKEILYASFEVRPGLDKEQLKEMMRYLVLAKVVPQTTTDAIAKRIFP
jgi:ubiquinone/menaquinone biosynthesis C-methylase UbiE